MLKPLITTITMLILIILIVTIIYQPQIAEAFFWCGGWGTGMFGWGGIFWWIIGFIVMFILIAFGVMIIVLLFKEITGRLTKQLNIW